MLFGFDESEQIDQSSHGIFNPLQFVTVWLSSFFNRSLLQETLRALCVLVVKSAEITR